MEQPTIDRIIATLERTKHEHYTEPEGLHSCPAVQSQGDYITCDCGADKINAEIDEAIALLRKG